MPIAELVNAREDSPESRAPRAGATVPFRDPLLAAWCWIVLVTVTLYQYGKGLLLARRRGSAVWGPVLRDWATGLIALGGVRVHVEGSPRVEGPAVLVANHQSAFDIAVLASLVPPPVVFVARSDLFAVPIVGGVLRRGGHLAVGRDARKDPRRIVEASLEQLQRGGKVIFFAEGTRSLDGAVQPLRAGAFLAAREARCPLVPVALAGTRHIVAKGGRLLRPSRVAVSFLAPMTVEEEGATPAARRRLRSRLAEEVRRLEPMTGPSRGHGPRPSP